MKRKIEQKLIEWKNSPNRMPLIVNGARQIGKTYSILEFGEKNYQNISLSNFVKQYKCPYSIRISQKNFGFENNIKSIPFYALFNLNFPK